MLDEAMASYFNIPLANAKARRQLELGEFVRIVPTKYEQGIMGQKSNILGMIER